MGGKYKERSTKSEVRKNAPLSLFSYFALRSSYFIGEYGENQIGKLCAPISKLHPPLALIFPIFHFLAVTASITLD
jgi:hypothetical protein